MANVCFAVLFAALGAACYHDGVEEMAIVFAFIAGMNTAFAIAIRDLFRLSIRKHQAGE